MPKYVGQHSGSSKGASDGTRGERSKPFDPASRQPVSVDEKFRHPEMGKIRHPRPDADIRGKS